MSDRFVVFAENWIDGSRRILGTCLGDKDIPGLYESDCTMDEELVWTPVDDPTLPDERKGVEMDNTHESDF